MKISINYDLLGKIKEAKVGFSLQRYTQKIIIGSSITIAIVNLLAKSNIQLILSCVTANAFVTSVVDGLNLLKTSELAFDELEDKVLVQLKDMDINTDLDLLLDSYIYKKEYKLEFNKNYIPHVTQNKYIMVPTYDNNGGKWEKSLVQEHIIGSHQYTLSQGSARRY